MIETIVLNYLKAQLGSKVYMEKPSNKTEFVLIEKTGSGQENFINSATLTIQSYADSMYKAAALNEAVKKAMIGDGSTSFGIIADDTADISSCSLNSDYNYTDTTTKSYRYQAVYDLVF